MINDGDPRDGMNGTVFYPGIFQAIQLLIFLLLLLIGLGTIIEGLGFFQGEALVVSIGNTIAFAIILAWGSRKAKAPLAEIFPILPFPITLLIPMGLVIIGISIVGSELDNVFRAIFPPPDWLNDLFLRIGGHGTSLLSAVIALVIVAPTTEELLFRGLFLRGFLNKYRAQRAVLASGILFGLFHLNPWQFIHTTVIGILLAWWFLRTRSLIPCIFGHALNNGLLFIYRDIFRLDISGYTGGMGQGFQFQPLWLDIIGLILLGSGIWVLIRRFRHFGNALS
jgi:membrane protease YdiL (CAAX protease family)